MKNTHFPLKFVNYWLIIKHFFPDFMIIFPEIKMIYKSATWHHMENSRIEEPMKNMI